LKEEGGGDGGKGEKGRTKIHTSGDEISKICLFCCRNSKSLCVCVMLCE